MGRRKKEIDQEQFERLCAMQCTEEEICDWFEVTDKTLVGWCKRTYGKNFSEVFAQKRGRGKIALRRSQFRLAENNANMAIWLGKQYLGQSDNPGSQARDTQPDDPLTAALKELVDNGPEH